MEELNIEETDLYELLGVKCACSTSDIKKAYRKKALEFHPDKNPDNPNAAALFHKLTKVLEILTDDSARKAYDTVRRAKKEAAQRHSALDDKRKRLKEDLEAKERAARGFAANNEKTAEEKLKDEIARLREEGSRQVQEEVEFVMQQILREQRRENEQCDSSKHRIKIRWTVDKNEPSNGGYTQENLYQFLSKYGDIVVLVMSPKKKGSALVEFKTKRGAEMAFDLEKGLAVNPLQLQWVNEPQRRKMHSTLIKESDYESVVLTKMRQAEERKRLIEQMVAEDKDSET